MIVCDNIGCKGDDSKVEAYYLEFKDKGGSSSTWLHVGIDLCQSCRARIRQRLVVLLDEIQHKGV